MAETTPEMTPVTASTTPEHDKLSAVRERSQEIGGFLAWAQEREIILAVPRGPGDGPPDPGTVWYVPCHRSVTDLLAQYFEIDLSALEREKRAMLAALSRTGSVRVAQQPGDLAPCRCGAYEQMTPQGDYYPVPCPRHGDRQDRDGSSRQAGEGHE